MGALYTYDETAKQFQHRLNIQKDIHLALKIPWMGRTRCGVETEMLIGF